MLVGRHCILANGVWFLKAIYTRHEVHYIILYIRVLHTVIQ